MLPSVVSLVERFTPLARDRWSDHRTLLVKFAEPLYAAFEEVHLDYVRIYTEYREDVKHWCSFRENIDAFCDRLSVDHGLSSSLDRAIWNFQNGDIRPVLRDFVQTVGWYLGRRVTEIHYSEGSFWVFPSVVPNLMVQFQRLKADPDNAEDHLMEVVRRFIDRVLGNIDSSKQGVDKAYEWQRTKLLR